jgi:MerR family copper efflux transcriptional regulator
MNIGEAAKATGMSVKMIRYYESIDLIQPHGRAESGYRIYKESDVHVMRFVRQTRALGFSIERVKHLLPYGEVRTEPARMSKRLP